MRAICSGSVFFHRFIQIWCSLFNILWRLCSYDFADTKHASLTICACAALYVSYLSTHIVSTWWISFELYYTHIFFPRLWLALPTNNKSNQNHHFILNRQHTLIHVDFRPRWIGTHTLQSLLDSRRPQMLQHQRSWHQARRNKRLKKSHYLHHLHHQTSHKHELNHHRNRHLLYLQLHFQRLNHHHQLWQSRRGKPYHPRQVNSTSRAW